MIGYDKTGYFNERLKAPNCQLNLLHGTEKKTKILN